MPISGITARLSVFPEFVAARALVSTDGPSHRYVMPIVAAKKKSARTPAPAKPAKTKKNIPSWIGSGVGKGFVKPGVDLTKPSLSPGEHL